MESTRLKYNPYFVRTAGVFSIFAGIISLASVFYIFVVLSSMGLSIEMFEDSELLLKWIKENNLAYSFLWVQTAAVAVFMLPVPFATSQLFRHRTSRSSSLATASFYVGLCGFYLLITATIIFYSVSPLTANAYAKSIENAVLFHEIFAALGMQFRLFGEFLISIWILGIALHLIRRNKIDMFGWYCLGFFVFTTIITIAKSFNLFDWEPLLGIVLAFTYIWLGLTMRAKAA